MKWQQNCFTIATTYLLAICLDKSTCKFNDEDDGNDDGCDDNSDVEYDDDDDDGDGDLDLDFDQF